MRNFHAQCFFWQTIERWLAQNFMWYAGDVGSLGDCMHLKIFEKYEKGTHRIFKSKTFTKEI